jgi:hypothetical protein
VKSFFTDAAEQPAQEVVPEAAPPQTHTAEPRQQRSAPERSRSWRWATAAIGALLVAEAAAAILVGNRVSEKLNEPLTKLLPDLSTSHYQPSTTLESSHGVVAKITVDSGETVDGELAKALGYRTGGKHRLSSYEHDTVEELGITLGNTSPEDGGYAGRPDTLILPGTELTVTVDQLRAAHLAAAQNDHYGRHAQ